MSSAFQRGKIWYLRVPTRLRGWRTWTTGTRNSAIADGLVRLVNELGPQGRRDWLILDAIHNGQLSLGRLWDASQAGELDQLRLQLKDVDLEPHVAEWLKETRTRVAPDTLLHYGTHVRTFIPKGRRFPASQFTPKNIRDWLASVNVGASTRRKYFAALSSFAEFLVAGEILSANPVRTLRPPPPAKPRDRYLEQPEILRLLAAMPEPHRTVSALIHATAMDVSTAVELRRSDFEQIDGGWEIRARGTKSIARDRFVTVAEWAEPYFVNLLPLLLPDAPLFPGLNRWTLSDVHRKVCLEIGITDYTLRDARHSHAVWMMRAGAPPQAIADQLGHANPQLVLKVYGKYRRDRGETRIWHRRAAEMDKIRGIT